MCHRISNGLNTWILEDPWVPNEPNFIPKVRCGVSMDVHLVADLIDRDTRQWDRGKLSILFEPSSMTNILNIHLPIHIQQDQIYWCLFHSGEFSVKSTYQAIRCSTHSRQVKIGKSCGNSKLTPDSRIFCGKCARISSPLALSLITALPFLLWIALYVIMPLKHWSIFFYIISRLPKFGLWLLGLSLSTIQQMFRLWTRSKLFFIQALNLVQMMKWLGSFSYMQQYLVINYGGQEIKQEWKGLIVIQQSLLDRSYGFFKNTSKLGRCSS